MVHRGTVFIVDEPAATRGPLETALLLEGLVVEAFAGPDGLLDRLAEPAQWPCCVVGGARLPEAKNRELQDRLYAQGLAIPVIQRGSVGEITAPGPMHGFDGPEPLGTVQNVEALLEKIASALELSIEMHRMPFEAHEVRCRLARLTAKETGACRLMLRGKTSKEIAIELQISIPTVAKYRKKILEKFRVRNTVELVQLIASFSAVAHAERTHNGNGKSSVEHLLHDLADDRPPKSPHAAGRPEAAEPEPVQPVTSSLG
jgi:FixJ family two-component response regulator